MVASGDMWPRQRGLPLPAELLGPLGSFAPQRAVMLFEGLAAGLSLPGNVQLDGGLDRSAGDVVPTAQADAVHSLSHLRESRTVG